MDHISVCICTLKRQKMLKKLLINVLKQETNNLFDISVTVIDNDENKSAHNIVKDFQDFGGVVVRYAVEPIKSIPVARNHAIKISEGDFIALIDDDEFPVRNWLLNHYNAIKTFDIDGTLGPVYPFFEKKAPNWVLKGNFCEREVLRTGTFLKWDQTRSGNVLLKKEIFDKANIYFDENYKTGGSDREFFKVAMNKRFKFIFVKEAPVYEWVPLERQNLKYFLKRAIVNGTNSHKNIKSEHNDTLYIIKKLKIMFLLFIKILLLPLAAIFGKHVLFKQIESILHHLGNICSTFNIELIKKRDF